jgi:small subunit ribosomal protein S18
MPFANGLDRAARTASGARPGRPRACLFCSGSVDRADYKDVELLRRFMTNRGRIRARAATGNCDQHQREVATAVKIAREVALLPYAQGALKTGNKHQEVVI